MKNFKWLTKKHRNKYYEKFTVDGRPFQNIHDTHIIFEHTSPTRNENFHPFLRPVGR